MLPDRVLITVEAPLLPAGVKLQVASDERRALATLFRMLRFAEDYQEVLRRQEAVEQAFSQREPDAEKEPPELSG